jgi:hypothetical protein
MENVVSSRKARSTGTVVEVIDNRDGSYDTGDLGWFTECVDHGNNCSHLTRKLAEYFASAPEIWCPTCQEA